MTRRSRTTRALVGALGAATLALSLSGCTLISTIAGGGPTPTTTTTPTETTSPKPTTASPTPTQSQSPKPTGASPTPTQSSGITMTDNIEELELWLAEKYQSEYGSAATVDCPGTGDVEIYDGFTLACTATETGGAKYTFTMEAANVTSSGYDVYFDRKKA